MKFDKLVLGSMKYNKYFKNSDELSSFLSYAHKKGIRQIHLSNEYNSYNLLLKSLKKIQRKKFSFIIKLAEPKNDKTKCSLKRFVIKFNKYCTDLGLKKIDILQLVMRQNCNHKKKYLINEDQAFNKIKKTIIKLKKGKTIKNFYFFPYHKNETRTNKHKFIDGITCYRNVNQNRYESFAKKNKLKIIAMRVFGGNKKIIKKNNLKKLLTFNLKSKLVYKVILGINNKDQINQVLKLC